MYADRYISSTYNLDALPNTGGLISLAVILRRIYGRVRNWGFLVQQSFHHFL